MTSTIATAKSFGEKVRSCRKALKMTQRELALAIGVGERFIVDLEQGKETCQLEKALRAAKAVGMCLVDEQDASWNAHKGSNGYDLGDLS